MMCPAARRCRIPVALMLSAALSACTPRAAPPAAAPPPVPAPIDHDAEIAALIGLLDRGDAAAAGPRIDALLARDPADPQARVLRASIDADPVALLGPKSFPYAVRPGDTMLGLAQRFLGTPLKSYQLARYNGIAVPASLAAGTVLRIPGIAPRPAGDLRPRVPRAKPVPAAAKADPAAARAARAAGLAALNMGQLDRAIASLRRAAVLDPGDPLIQRDLARAQRVAATVAGRH